MRPALETRTQAVARIGRLRWYLRGNGTSWIAALPRIEARYSVGKPRKGVANWCMRPALEACTQAVPDPGRLLQSLRRVSASELRHLIISYRNGLARSIIRRLRQRRPRHRHGYCG